MDVLTTGCSTVVLSMWECWVFFFWESHADPSAGKTLDNFLCLSKTSFPCVCYHVTLYKWIQMLFSCLFVCSVFPSQALRLPWLLVRFDCKGLWESVCECLCWTMSWTLTSQMTSPLGLLIGPFIQMKDIKTCDKVSQLRLKGGRFVLVFFVLYYFICSKWQYTGFILI